jgi:hypothetical protein
MTLMDVLKMESRDKVRQLRENMFDREVWRNKIKEVSFAQKNKQLTSTT